MSRRVFPENRDDLMDSVITSPPRFQQCIYNVCTFTELNVRRGHQIPKLLSAKIFIGRKGEEQGLGSQIWSLFPIGRKSDKIKLLTPTSLDLTLEGRIGCPSARRPTVILEWAKFSFPFFDFWSNFFSPESWPLGWPP